MSAGRVVVSCWSYAITVVTPLRTALTPLIVMPALSRLMFRTLRDPTGAG